MVVHEAFISNLVVNATHYIAGNSQTDPFIPAGLGENKRINPDDATAGIYQRSTTIARINGRIRLHINRRTVWIWLSRDGAHNPHAHRIIKTKGAAEGQD